MLKYKVKKKKEFLREQTKIILDALILDSTVIKRKIRGNWMLNIKQIYQWHKNDVWMEFAQETPRKAMKKP